MFDRNEYPRPQFRRESWQSLNGEWEFAFDDKNDGVMSGLWQGKMSLPMKINVPFSYQYPASGIGDTSPKRTEADARCCVSTPPTTKRMYG